MYNNSVITETKQNGADVLFITAINKMSASKSIKLIYITTNNE